MALAPISCAPISLATTRLRVKISPLGAELVRLADAEGREFLWDGDETFWSGRAPLLFPMVGRASGDHILVEGVAYPLPQHGFARRSLFALIEQEPSRAKFRLEDDEASREKFPFRFRLDVDYALTDTGLTLAATVINRDAKPLPCGFGFHPAFRWPLPGATGTHEIIFDQDETAPFYLLEDGLLLEAPQVCPIRDRRLPLEPQIFDRGALVFSALNSRKVTFKAPGAPSVSVAFPDLPHFGLWSKPGAPFVCLEPWQGFAAPVGYDGEFAQRPGVISIPPGAAKTFAMTIEIGG